MAISRDIATDLVQALAQIHIDAQTQLAIRTAAALRRGIDSPQWIKDKAASANELELALRTILRKLKRQTSGKLAEAVAAAYERGGAAAAEEVASHLSEDAAARAAVSLPQSAAVQRLVLSQVSKLEGTHLPVLRSVMDAYREVVAAGGAGDVLTGVSTRRQATQRVWSELLNRGIASFTDVRGRRMNLASYAEMATRTTVAQAAVEGHLDKLADLDLDLVIVSNSAQECELCRKWEGKILARTHGGQRSAWAENPATGEIVQIEIAGSVAEAIREGLMHPNCRHSFSAFFPGLTEVPTNTADPVGDAERQRLRALERRLRRLRTQEEAALDDGARARYGRLAEKARADIRAHVKDKKNLMRKPERELIDLGHKRAAAPTAPPPKKAAPKKAVVLSPAEAGRARSIAGGNPEELTGSGKWFEALPGDTGPDYFVPVKDFEVVSGYTVASGRAYRIDGVTYLIEDRKKPNHLGPEQVLEEFRAIHAGLPGADKYQRGYAWLTDRNPDDAYWERAYNMPGFESLATAGDGGVRVWNRGGSQGIFGPREIKSSLDHEFGHNVSSVAKTLDLDDGSRRWRNAVLDDGVPETPPLWMPINSPGAHPMLLRAMPGRTVPNGISEYGTSSAGEDYAETMRFYLQGSIGNGRLRRGGPIVDIYLRDLWPKRAALFDELFPEIAAEQRKITRARAG